MAALQHGGKTIAVIGTGLDVFYPKPNKRLQDYIGNDHLVLSEYGPGEQPLKFHFPARNRIIAGLCRGVIVAEAKMRSGSLITCERAMEEGRDVFAIPGSIFRWTIRRLPSFDSRRGKIGYKWARYPCGI